MGGSGGGGGAGKVEYPPHITHAHSNWLDNDTNDHMTYSMADLMEAAINHSPWLGKNAYDPDTKIADMASQLSGLEALALLFSPTINTLIANFSDPTRITDDIDAFADQFDDQLTSIVYPRFDVGMRDICAVVSSAFVVGRAIIEDGRDREVAKYASALRLKAYGEDSLSIIGMRLELQKTIAQLGTEIARMSIVAKKEEMDTNATIDEADSRWGMEAYVYGGNLLAAPGGGVGMPGKRSTAASAIGGALSMGAAGAGIGAQIATSVGSGATMGGVYGAAAGLVVGAIGGIISSS